MEQFRLRIRNEPKRGVFWELHLFPRHPRRHLRESDARIMGSSSVPESIYWLKIIAEPFLLRGEPAMTLEEFSQQDEPSWLQVEDGMRLSLAFASARYLVTPRQRRMFVEGMKTLPSEVVLYWFTLCFYGYRQAAGRAAFRTLLTHEEAALERSASRPRKRGGFQLSMDFLHKTDTESQPTRSGRGEQPGRIRDNHPAPAPA